MKNLYSLLLLFIIPTFAYAQEKTITGTVIDESGSVVPGVNIFIKNTSRGTISDFNGKYTLVIPESADILVFSFIGYNTLEEQIGDRSNIDVVMIEDTRQLDEVVVTGYSTQNKRDIIGAISSIDPENLKDMPIAGLDQAMQGQIAGVTVTQSSGTPGGGLMVRIRGNSSISSSNRPLYIVDGVPVADGGLSSRSFGGQGDNALAMLNPNDIESIEVLKDASAKAIYGSRAANGVVLITTKKGKMNSKTTFEVDVQRGMIDPVAKLDMLEAEELLQLQREAMINAGEDPDQAGIPGITDQVNTDWVDEIMRTGILEQYQVSASGGSDKTSFYMSAAYRGEEGIIYNNEFRRLTGTLNLDHQATDRLTIGINLNLSRSLNKRIKGDNFLDGVYTGALNSLPYYQPWDENGNLVVPGDPNYAEFPNFNPVAQATEPRFDTHGTRIIGGAGLKYEILPNLTFSTKFSIDYLTTIEDQFEPTTTAIGGWATSTLQQGYGINITSEGSTFINSSIFNYNTQFGEKHELGALLGTEVISRTSRSNSVVGLQFPRDDLSYLVSSGLIIDGSSLLTKSGLLSFLSEVNYKYANKYMLKLNARYDGSSRFGEARKFGFFPSASVGWRISEETFLQNTSVIDDLKLRASYGITGNERIGNFQFLGTWAAVTAYNGVPGLGPATLGNPDLGWEQTTEFNTGFDLSLLDGQIQVVFDYYYNLTEDLLLTEPLPFTTGFGSVLNNIGEVSNEGLELALNTVNIDKKLRWSTLFNISRNINTVRKLASNEPVFTGYQTTPASSTHIVTPSQPLGTFWGLRFLGVDPATGDAIYEDYNGDGRITGEDGTIIGSAQPDLVGGITNNLYYGHFDLSFFFQGSYGNEMINFTKQGLIDNGASIQNNQMREALMRWQNEGDVTHIPKYEFGNNYNNYFSSRFVEDASYLRLKNVTIGYSLPEKIISKARISKLRIYASGTNLWTLTNYTGVDPELNSLDGSTSSQGLDFYTLPQVRTILVGLNLGF